MLVPSTVTSVLIFLLVVTPGIATELLWQRTRPRRDESTFVEIARVLLAGVVLTSLSTALLALLRLAVPQAVVDTGALLSDRQDYISHHAGQVVRTLTGLPTLALLLGIAAVDLLTPARAKQIAQETLWHSAFTRTAPPGTRSFLSIQMKDGATITGYQAGYSTEPDPAKRELLLAAPLSVRHAQSAKPVTLDGAWQRMLIAGSEISSVVVTYVGQAQPPPGHPPHDRALKWVSGHVWQVSLGAALAVLILLTTIGL